MTAVQLAGRPLEKTGLVLTLEPGVDIDAADTCIEAIQGHREIGPSSGDRSRHLVGKSCRGVHWHRDCDTMRPGDVIVSQLVYCQVDGPNFVPGVAQRGRGRGEMHRLTTQLVSREKKDPHAPQLTDRLWIPSPRDV
jgi:hypothetical protein